MTKIKNIGKTELILYKLIYKVFYIIQNVYHYSRTYVISSQFQNIGENTVIDHDIWINKGENISIGSSSFIGRNVYLNAFDKIEIGNYCAIAAGTKFITANHSYGDLNIPINQQEYIKKPIVLNNDIWIGYNVIILPGVILEDGCVVAAGSVVTKSFKKNSIIAGVPAKLIKTR